MARIDDSERWQDEFPQLFAAWKAMQTAAQRASGQVRQSAAAPSAWTFALLSGGLALMLAVVLLFVDPQQTAAIKASHAHGLLGPEAARLSPGNLELGVDWLSSKDVEWEEFSTEQWTSTTPAFAAPAFAAIPDDWTTASPRPAPLVARAEPYYLRADYRALEDFTAAITTEESPSLLAGPEVDRTVGIVLERSPATTDETGTLTYTLNVRNLDVNPVEHVRVIETGPQADQILDTRPAALMTPDGALVWQLADLQPLESRTMTVTLDGSQVTSSLETVAALDVETKVSVKTRIFPLALTGVPPDQPIEPELALPESEPAPAPVAQPEFEPINPLLTDDPAPLPYRGWTPYGRDVAPADLEPIAPELTGESPVVLPEQFDPFVPEDEPIVPLLGNPFQSDIADEPVQPAPAPRPLPLETAHPPRPILSVKANARNAVRTGDVLTTEYRIKNEGDAPAEGIVLTIYLPPELRHKHGEQVEHRIDRLLPGETHNARLLTKAAAAGTAELDAVLSYDGRSEDEHKLTVRVMGSPSPKAPQRPR